MKGPIHRFILPLAAAALPILASCSLTSKEDRPRLRETVSYAAGPDSSMTRGERSMSGRLTVSRYSYLGYFNLTRNNVSVLIDGPWGQQLDASLPESVGDLPIDPQRKYRVDLLTCVHSYENGTKYISNEVSRVSDSGKVVFDASICPVHKMAMDRQVEDWKSAEDYSRAFILKRERSFPNDGIAYVGCGSGTAPATWKCPECAKLSDHRAKLQGIDR